MRHYFEIYNKAYCEIGSLTPISADCGSLCGAKCCKGDENDGMIVFPGEENLLSSHGYEIRKSEMNGYPVFFTSCSGSCNRVYRPLSCRIFPLAPALRDGKLEIIPDPRAKYICPLLFSDSVEEKFKKAVEKAFLQLISDEKIAQMLIHYTAMLDEYNNFTK